MLPVWSSNTEVSTLQIQVFCKVPQDCLNLMFLHIYATLYSCNMQSWIEIHLDHNKFIEESNIKS